MDNSPKKLHYSKWNNNDVVRNQSNIFVMKALFDIRKCLQCIQSTFLVKFMLWKDLIANKFGQNEKKFIINNEKKNK